MLVEKRLLAFVTKLRLIPWTGGPKERFAEFFFGSRHREEQAVCQV
jgi:hypothetical protein